MIPSSCDAATTHAREKRSCQTGARDRLRSCEIDSVKLIHPSFIARPPYRQEPVAPAPQRNATGSDNKLAARILARRTEEETDAPIRSPRPLTPVRRGSPDELRALRHLLYAAARHRACRVRALLVRPRQ